MNKEFKRDLLPNCRKKGMSIDISKDMLSYIITCRDRYPFFSDEILQKWVEEKVRYAQQVLGEESEKAKQDSR
mgnify:CR=1 FL=1